jgi:uncharacterized protein DUF4136
MFSQFQPRRLAALALAAVLTGCASAPATHVVTDPQTDLRTYRTFSFSEAGKGEYSTIAGNRLEQATRVQLQRLGYSYVERNADLRVYILLKVEDQQELRSVPTSAGRFAYRGWVSSAVETVHYREGTLAIDLVDTKRNAMVWRGVTGDRISKSDMKNPGATIDSVVRELFATLPVSGS